jgi:hypothetical protein
LSLNLAIDLLPNDTDSIDSPAEPANKKRKLNNEIQVTEITTILNDISKSKNDSPTQPKLNDLELKKVNGYKFNKVQQIINLSLGFLQTN